MTEWVDGGGGGELGVVVGTGARSRSNSGRVKRSDQSGVLSSWREHERAKDTELIFRASGRDSCGRVRERKKARKPESESGRKTDQMATATRLCVVNAGEGQDKSNFGELN